MVFGVRLRTVIFFLLVQLLAFIYNPMSEESENNTADVDVAVVDRVDASTIQGKFMMGYQGWFFCGGDGAPVDPGHHGWIHWINQPLANDGNVSFDLWPSTRELDDDELYEIPGLTIPADPTDPTSTPRPARLFSSRNPKTVNRHFRWMREFDLPGVFLQRFLGEVNGGGSRMALRDEVTQRVREAAEKEGRVFANMWDLSGVPGDKIEQNIKDDWLHMINDEKILESPSYLHEDGRPVIAIWGMGFADRGLDPDSLIRMIQWLRQSVPTGVWIMAGTPTYWNRAMEDQDPNPDFAKVWKEVDAISPWAVGRFGDLDGADGYHEDKTIRDMEIIQNEDQDRPGGPRDYIPVVFPGFSWKNLHGGPLNEISRQGGRFLYRQLYNTHQSNARCIYGAMFDEYDEATALMPAEVHKSRVPTERPFLSLDADGDTDIPDNWYLRICALSSRALKSGQQLPEEFPRDFLFGKSLREAARTHDEL
ncbi:hypothetical protein [Phaffia rhodozyma]|uniref:Xylosidase/arabinosidase n=1 Tax=Phaffia rhodozyma TaxID=264483 RepID=A0A0F7SL66_PHARH|nr:hypothetical protein [Phaffia rhodozyma]